jgi:hypothetical protein
MRLINPIPSRPEFMPTDNPMFPAPDMFVDPFACASPGTCFGPAAPFIAIGASVLSAGMTVLGSISAANAQRAQGDIAMRNAQLRQQQMEAQAREQEQEALQQRAAANNAAAVGQREAIEARRKGQIMAGRAQTVMAAAGAGVDDSMTAGLLSEGKYASDVALYQGSEKARVFRNQGLVNDFNAASLRATGQGGVWSAEQTKGAFDTAAANTLTTGIGKAAFGLAAQYGGNFGGSGSDVSFADYGGGNFSDSAAYKNAPASWTRAGFEDIA